MTTEAPALPPRRLDRTAGAHARQPTSRRSTAKVLPVWPLGVLYIGFPVMWVLGLGGFAPQIGAVPMIICLLTRGRIRVPRGFSVWLFFLFWVLCSSAKLHTASRLVGFGYRYSLYLAATVVFVYVYNTAPDRLPLSRLARLLCIFLGVVVAGGYLGLLDPHGSLSTPFQHIVPASFASNDLVGRLVHPAFAQTAGTTLYRVRPRPAAPFAYTNDWGVNYALLIPFAVVAFVTTRSGRTRAVIGTLVLVSVVPALLTLNRGMLLGLGVGFVYVALRFAARGNVRGLLVVTLMIGLAFTAMSVLHFGSLLHDRTSQSSSLADRTSSYTADIDAVKQSPIIGYGAPSASTVSVDGPYLGTQGQLWSTLYSTGFPGGVLFVGSLVVFAWRTRRPRGTPLMWMHAVPVMALAMIPVYRLDATELTIVMAAVALALRDLPARRLSRVAAPSVRQAQPHPVTA